MNEKTLDRVLTEIDSLPKLKEVVIGGLGEPLLHPGFAKTVQFIKSRRIATTITTNGSLLDMYIDFCIEQGVDTIEISYETGKIGHHDQNDILGILRKLNKRKAEYGKEAPAVNLAMVISKENIGDLMNILEMIENCGIREIHLSNLLATTKEHQDLVLYPRPETDEIKAFKNARSYRLPLEKYIFRIPKFEIQTERNCDFIEKNSLVIRWDGEITPCYRFLHSGKEIVLNNVKTIKACTFGSILHESLFDIWNKREYVWFRYNVHNSFFPSCIDCLFRNGCEIIESTERDCWSNENSCADCLWARDIIKCS
jgi:tungsten cofactor oxidoreducase radical SAM maturase